MRATLSIVLSLAAGVASAAAPDEALVERLKEILRSPKLDEAMVGVHVRSMKDGRTIFERNGTKLFNPASNVKLATTAAALWYLGPNYHFKTIAYRDRDLRGGVLRGNLYIRGGGDPTLTNENLFGFVSEIALRGIDEVTGDLVIDDGFFDKVQQGPGWEQERSDKSYAPPMSALSANYGTYSIRVMPGDSVGAPGRVTAFPNVPSVEISNAVSTRGHGARPRIWIGTSKEPGKIVVTVRGTVSLGDPFGATFYKPVAEPTLYAGEVIRELLSLRGVTIKGKLRFAEVPRTGVVPIVTHYSRPLAEISSTLNKFSNNFIAEQMLKTLGAELKGAPGTWESGSAVIKDFLLEIGIPKDSLVLGNGSGLNDVNRMTPEQMTRVLEAMHRRFEVQPEFVASLAVAGVSGTITRRFDAGPAEQRLRAKTGSLQGVSALSGYVVSRDDELFAFSVMMNDYRGRARTMWNIQDEIGHALADFSHSAEPAHAEGRSGSPRAAAASGR